MGLAAPVAAVAYGIYMLGGVIARAATKKIAQRLLNANFRPVSSGVAKSKANIVNANNNNIIRIITRGIKGARTSTKGPITKGTKVQPKPRTQTQVKEALKRNANKISGKEFGKRKLAEFDRVGPKPKPSSTKSRIKEKLKSTPTSFAIPPGLTSSSNRTSSAPSVTRAEDYRDFENRMVEKANKENKIVREQINNKADSLIEIVNSDLGKKVIKEIVKDTTTTKKAEVVKKQLSEFEKKFKAARAAKKYSFKFKGKEITTRYK